MCTKPIVKSVLVENHSGLIKYCTICDNRKSFIKNLISHNQETKEVVFNLQCPNCGTILMNIKQKNVADISTIFGEE